jgi:hypothetical protein
MEYNLNDSVEVVLDGITCKIQLSTINYEIEELGYIFVHLFPQKREIAIIAVTHVTGTCALNDVGMCTWLRDEQKAYTKIAEGVICWYKDDPTSNLHQCRSCMSNEFELYDTGIRLPALGTYSAAV